MTDGRQPRIVIIGGGVAGLAVASALASIGWPSTIVEPRPLRDLDMNRGDGLQPLSLVLLNQWGVLPVLEREGLRSFGLEVRHPRRGTLLNLDLRQAASVLPYAMNVPHATIERVLREHVEATGTCHWIKGAWAEGYEGSGGQKGVRVRTPDGPVDIPYDILVGADGAASHVRRWAGITFQDVPYDHAMLVLHAEEAAFGAFTATRAYVSRLGGVILIPLPANRLRVCLLLKESDVRRWQSASEEEIAGEIARRVPGLTFKRLDRRGQHVYRLHRLHADAYWRGNVVLVGDAAHVTHPAAGQGMNMALQDAAVLVREWVRAASAGDTWAEAHRRYEAARRAVNESVMNRAEFMAYQLWPRRGRDYMRVVVQLATLRYLLPFVARKVAAKLARANSGCLDVAMQHAAASR